VRTGGGAVEGDEQPVLDLLRKVVLEGAGEAIGLVPGIAEHVRQEALDDAMPADHGDRNAPSRGRQADAAIRRVLEEHALGEALDRRRDRPRRQIEGLGERAGVGERRPAREAIDRLQ
jgi:hypothetical protein